MKLDVFDVKWYADWRFWLLFIAINISGNPGFSVLFPYHATLIILFVGLLSYFLIQKQSLDNTFFIYILLWTCLFLFQGYYIDAYGFSSAIHVIMKVTIGLLTLLVVNYKFTKYYSNIIYFFCIVSLICFTYNHIFGVLPYINLGAGMDGGAGFRVSSIIYTQLYNLNNSGLSFRNCGPFWEPGAFQGFVNLAILLELLSGNDRNKQWHLRFAVFVITVITTYSTGGYVVLALNLIYYIVTNQRLIWNVRVLLLSITSIIAVFLFFNIDFLHNKISGDKGRLGTSAADLFSNNILCTIFGYGFSEESFTQSNIKSASSFFNLFRYTGIIGIALYYIPILGIKLNANRLYFLLTVFLILMNEPFITAGVFWWSIPLLFPFIYKSSYAYESDNKI